MIAGRPGRAAARRALFTLAAYAAILAAISAVLGTWTDEEYTLATTGHGLAYAWRRAFSYEVQAPLYFGIMAIWREANGSVWFARLFSVLCATGFFAILFPIGRRIARDRDPLPFAVILACNPFVIWAALEIRLYAFALLIAALLWLAVDTGFARGDRRIARVAFVACGVAALYTQYFLGFLFIAYAVPFAIERRWRALVSYAIGLAAIGVATVPLVVTMHAQVGTISDLSTEPLSRLLHDTVVHPWLDFILPYDRAWDAVHVRAPYAVLVVLLTALVAYARPKFSLRTYAALAAAAAVEGMFVLTVAVFGLGLQPRHFVALFLPVLLAAYELVLAVARSGRPRIATLLVTANVALGLGALFTSYVALAKNGDARRIGPFLAQHARARDAIAIFPADALPAYRRQYAGLAPLLAFPHALNNDRYDDAGLTVRSDAQVAAALRRLQSGHARVWLVVQGDCDPSRPFYGCDHVYAGVRGAHVLSDHHFFKGRVFEIGAAPSGPR